MPCYHPISGYICQDGLFRTWNKVINREEGKSQTIPCGQCVGCRLERSRQWAVRCMHEASMHEFNSFITLTYNDLNVPEDFSLDYSHFQDFMKRFKRKVHRKFGSAAAREIRFYMCGEYGEQFDRPHFHACIFGFDFPDKRLWTKTDSGAVIYRSEFLESLWTFGYSSIGDVNFQSAAYVARYVMKKVTGKPSDAHYALASPITGEVFNRVPEFNRMSLKPGIGATWFQKYSSDVFPHDYVVVNGKKAKPPRYYDKLFSILDDEVFEEVQYVRFLNVQNSLDDNTPDRLLVKEQVANSRLSALKRKLK